MSAPLLLQRVHRFHRPHLTGEKMAKEGSWNAFYGMWISSFILTPIAVYLTYKATNDSALLDTDWYAGRIKALKERLGKWTGRLFEKRKKKKTIKTKRNGKRDGTE